MSIIDAPIETPLISLSTRLGEKSALKFPNIRSGLLLSGAPGAGKGTNFRYLTELAKIEAGCAVEMSALLDTPEYRAIKDAGGLVGDKQAKAEFINWMSGIDSPRVLIDGLPRSPVQLELAEQLARDNPQARFSLINLHLNETVSCERQKERGKKAIEAGQAPRSSDLTEAKRIKRYGEYDKGLYIPLSQRLSDRYIRPLPVNLRIFSFDANMPIEAIRKTMYGIVKTQEFEHV